MKYLSTKIFEYFNKSNKLQKTRACEGWYRGENLSNIKTPCGCVFRWKGKRRIGILANSRFKKDGKQTQSWWILIDVTKQTPQDVGDIVAYSPNLKKILKKYKLQVAKAKIDVRVNVSESVLRKRIIENEQAKDFMRIIDSSNLPELLPFNCRGDLR